MIYNPDKTVSGEERELLVSDLTGIARDGFGANISRDDVENHVLKADVLYIIEKAGECIGFSSYDFLDACGSSILYLHGIVVKGDCQRKGLFRKVNREAIYLGDFDFLAMRTQSPVVYAAAAGIVGELYPNMCYSTPAEIKHIASYIGKDFLKMKQFDKNALVDRATYGMCLYGSIPRHYRADYFFDNVLKLDYNAGDSVLLIGGL